MLQMEEERELRLKRNEESLQEISDSMRKCNIRIIGIRDGECNRKLVQRNNSGEFPKHGKGYRNSCKRLP
ncbi:hypothetical protein, partial [Fusobacterium necrophorum]|uniref:hypothetical protein n=1 Tax=Fusobacterium necrophorum TaxID=859 RepID=UPI001C9CF1FA